MLASSNGAENRIGKIDIFLFCTGGSGGLLGVSSLRSSTLEEGGHDVTRRGPARTRGRDGKSMRTQHVVKFSPSASQPARRGGGGGGGSRTSQPPNEMAAAAESGAGAY